MNHAASVLEHIIITLSAQPATDLAVGSVRHGLMSDPECGHTDQMMLVSLYNHKIINILVYIFSNLSVL